MILCMCGHPDVDHNDSRLRCNATDSDRRYGTYGCVCPSFNPQQQPRGTEMATNYVGRHRMPESFGDHRPTGERAPWWRGPNDKLHTHEYQPMHTNLEGK